MRRFERSRQNPTHTVAPGTTITQRPDLEVGMKRVSPSTGGGMISGEQYSKAYATCSSENLKRFIGPLLWWATAEAAILLSF